MVIMHLAEAVKNAQKAPHLSLKEARKQREGNPRCGDNQWGTVQAEDDRVGPQSPNPVRKTNDSSELKEADGGQNHD